jgi:cytochrome c oxidase subunit 4
MTSSHIPSVKSLVSVWAALICLTWTTVGVSYIELGEFNVVIALVIALIKASLVAWIFMGVRFSAPMTRLFVVAGLVWLMIMIVITSGDYATRRYDYQPKSWTPAPATPSKVPPQ